MAAVISERNTHDAELSRAQEAVVNLVNNGDLERLVHLARLIGSAQDAMNDEMVTRLSATAGDGLDLLDRVNRSGVVKALPAITALVENGDLERLVHLARLAGAAQDALSDEMVTRLAGMAGDALGLVDRVTRTGAVERLLGVAEQVEKTHVLTDFLQCLADAAAEAAQAPMPKGGLGGLWEIVKQPETQQTIQFLMLVGKHFRSCRLAHPAEP
ncbi:MAG: hypothetical protein ACP5MM_09040 [Acidithiobacillus sp.]|uniref:hypothetical protein n=1 Tax=Acidithiobacillus sp. TaxID=1872118 RepID=UPI003D05733E